MYIPLVIKKNRVPLLRVKVYSGNKMKHIITLIFLSVCLLSCEGRSKLVCGGGGAKDSKTVDLRCQKLEDEAYKKGVETGVCYKIPENSEKLFFASEVERLNPDPEACKALYVEAKKKCDDLPPAGPDDIEQVSGGAVFEGNKPVMIDGKPVCD